MMPMMRPIMTMMPEVLVVRGWKVLHFLSGRIASRGKVETLVKSKSKNEINNYTTQDKRIR